MMADEPKYIANGTFDAELFTSRANRGDCSYCGGNDRDVPCLWPSEGKPGCLRDARLARELPLLNEKSPPKETST